MDLISLYYFSELAKDLHITRTANRLFISQQTLSNHIQRLDEMSARMLRAWQNASTWQERKLQLAVAKLNAYDPAHILKRGFAILFKGDSTVADSVEKVAPGEQLRARVRDGEIKVTVS